MLVFSLMNKVMAEPEILILDDKSNSQWRLVTDGVMGGVSSGQLSNASVDDQPCLKMTGNVSLDNNGGFIQAVTEVPDKARNQIKSYKGIALRVFGNNQQYNIHLRTSDLMLPWQSYRQTFIATPEWQTLYFPFEQFAPYRTNINLDISKIRRIGVVAIGRKFSADICFSKLAVYK